MNIIQGGYVCIHLLESEKNDEYRQFTGIGTSYNLICQRCRQNLEELPITLREVTQEAFYKLDSYLTDGFIGQPETFERNSNLFFVKRQVSLEFPYKGEVVSLAPQQDATISKWVALFSSQEIVLLDFGHNNFTLITTIVESGFQVSNKSVLYLSYDSKFAAIVNNRESSGMIVNLHTGLVTMRLNRGDYHTRETNFPIAFFQHNHKTLVVHATEWNRLDISDAETGEILTGRDLTYIDEQQPEHYLNYFHALPIISPNGSWIAEDGWVWSPFGVTRVWSLQNWLSENVWESEDGTSIKYLTQRGYYWNGPLCWVDDKILAVWGFGDDDEWLIPAVQLFDVETGIRIRLIAGINAETMYFDKYLFAVSSQGTEVWNIETGERLLEDTTHIPQSFHPRTREFLTINGNGEFLVGRLSDRHQG